MTLMVRQKYRNLPRLMAVVAFSAIGLSSCGNGLMCESGRNAAGKQWKNIG